MTWKVRDPTSKLLSLGALLVASITPIDAYFWDRHKLFISEEGLVVPASDDLARLRIRLEPDAHFNFVNAGNRPLLVDMIYFVAYQPQVAASGSAGQFDERTCVGDATSFQARSTTPPLDPRTIKRSEIAFSPDLSLEIPLRGENEHGESKRFVFCLSYSLRDTSGVRYVAAAPLWFAKFKEANGRLEPDGFSWLSGSREDVFASARTEDE